MLKCFAAFSSTFYIIMDGLMIQQNYFQIRI